MLWLSVTHSKNLIESILQLWKDVSGAGLKIITSSSVKDVGYMVHDMENLWFHSVEWSMVHSPPSLSPQQVEWERQPCSIPKIGVNAGGKTISARQPDVWSASLCWNRKSDVSEVPDQQRVMPSRFQSMWSPAKSTSPPPKLQWLQLHSDYWTYFKRYHFSIFLAYQPAILLWLRNKMAG